MNRREFLKTSGWGLAAVTIGSAGGTALFGRRVALADTAVLDLTMVDADAEMVDGVRVPTWAYESSLILDAGGEPAARIPGPVIFVDEGDVVRLTIRNEITNGGAHGFAVPGLLAPIAPLQRNEQATVEFVASRAGTYMYLDPENAPVNRVMGLHGALVVLPRPVGYRSPYSGPTENIARLFADLGTTAHFPGHFWDRDRNAIWVFNAIDPAKLELAADATGGISAATFLDGYLPQYFTINGKSGFFAAQHGASGAAHHGPTADSQAAISIHGNVGQPCLVRTLNAGLMWHSPHIHGNHVYLLSQDGVLEESLTLVDTWTMPPGAVKDVLLPMFRPPDIPAATWTRFENGTSEELFPLVFPMHDHNEISNTAAGANYPQGLATHFQFDGVVDPHDEVIQVDRAEVRVRTGQLFVSGRSSVPGGELMLHAGPDDTGPSLGTVIVAADGTFSFRGRALKALETRRFSIHSHHTGAGRHAIPLELR